QVAAVDRLALTTGSDPVPAGKLARGYRHEKDKFAIAGLAAVPSLTVAPPRVLQCPVQMEAVVEGVHHFSANDEILRGRTVGIEVRIQRVHIEQSILAEPNRVDPDKWRPLIMSFQKFYGLADGEAHDSLLGTVPEALYRSPDV